MIDRADWIRHKSSQSIFSTGVQHGATDKQKVLGPSHLSSLSGTCLPGCILIYVRVEKSQSICNMTELTYREREGRISSPQKDRNLRP